MSAYFVSQGAEVTAFDVSPRMIEYARRRLGPTAKLFVADMAQPLPNLASGSFDLVASSLALDYVRDWSAPFAEFLRVLKPGGRLVFSAQNPISAFAYYQPPSAFGVHYVEAAWKSFGGKPVTMPDHYRSFEEMINPLIQAGFSIQAVADSRPDERLKEIDPKAYERYSKSPFGLCISAIKA
jgi:ubiquinone/menaquinone biosynthesis C-methylase UbiE